ncbi:MAG: PEP-CTERM sorting domain-containing protein [Leptolyngbya sp. SIO3F4]|nr:PEP-CTERM sorting domain-containing protein [Leptolyngbya sp. SIO3F4]
MANAILDKFLETLVISAAVVGVTAQQVTAQGFEGSFAPDQWELFNSSPAFEGIDNSEITIDGIPLAPFNGSADFTDAPNSLTLLGSNQSEILDEFGLDCQSVDSFFLFLCDRSFTTVFVTVPEASILSFDWNYTTADFSTTEPFGPAFDVFGFSIGNSRPNSTRTDGRTFTELIDRTGPSEQTGTTSVEVGANQIFGLEIITSDNRNGRAMAMISQFRVSVIDNPASVPEPASTIAIAAVAGLGLGFTKRAQSKTKK